MYNIMINILRIILYSFDIKNCYKEMKIKLKILSFSSLALVALAG